MLKGKKGLYILLPLVAFIWGAIVYQILDAFSDEDTTVTTTTAMTFSKIENKTRDPFTISEIKRDPFLGTMYKPKKVVIKKPKPKIKKPEINWPTIQYKGLVTGSQNGTAVYLIQINGADQLMKRKDIINEVTLIKGSPASITVKYKGKTKQFDILN